jgi:hypothetical protein
MPQDRSRLLNTRRQEAFGAASRSAFNVQGSSWAPLPTSLEEDRGVRIRGQAAAGIAAGVPHRLPPVLRRSRRQRPPLLEDQAPDVVGEVARPIFTRARAMPIVRMHEPIAPSGGRKTCSMAARTLERPALPRRMWGGIGRPRGIGRGGAGVWTLRSQSRHDFFGRDLHDLQLRRDRVEDPPAAARRRNRGSARPGRARWSRAARHRRWPPIRPSAQDMPLYLERGEVVAKPALIGLEGDHVRFADGSAPKTDVVVYCTGYRVSFPSSIPTSCPPRATTSRSGCGLSDRARRNSSSLPSSATGSDYAAG